MSYSQRSGPSVEPEGLCSLFGCCRVVTRVFVRFYADYTRFKTVLHSGFSRGLYLFYARSLLRFLLDLVKGM